MFLLLIPIAKEVSSRVSIAPLIGPSPIRTLEAVKAFVCQSKEVRLHPSDCPANRRWPVCAVCSFAFFTTALDLRTTGSASVVKTLGTSQNQWMGLWDPFDRLMGRGTNQCMIACNCTEFVYRKP